MRSFKADVVMRLSWQPVSYWTSNGTELIMTTPIMKMALSDLILEIVMDGFS